MSTKDVEREWAEKAQRFVKAELKRADVANEELPSGSEIWDCRNQGLYRE